MTSAMLKAYAHPVRRRLERELNKRGSGRAVDLSVALGLPANQISFHLRVLVNAGLARVDPALGRDKRDRVYVPVAQNTEVGGPEHPLRDEHEEAMGTAVISSLAEDAASVLERVTRWAPEYASGHDPQVRAAFNNMGFRLTRAEFRELMEDVGQAVERARARHAERAAAGAASAGGAIGADGAEAAAPDKEAASDPDGGDTRYWDMVILAADDTI